MRPEGGSGSTEWKAYIVFTNLESLKGFPEKIGSLREQNPLHGGWTEKRDREREFADEGAAPTVIVVGGGQAGLQMAARLKVMGVPTLVVEKQARVGDQWRNRYEALCLHDPVCELMSPVVTEICTKSSQGTTICLTYRESRKFFSFVL